MKKPQHLVAAFFLALNTFLLFVALPVLFFAEEGHAQAPEVTKRRKVLVPPIGGAQAKKGGPTGKASTALQQALIETVEVSGIGEAVSAATAGRLPVGVYEPTLEKSLRFARDEGATHVLQVRILDHLNLHGDVQAVNLEAQLREVAENGRLVWRGKSVRAFPARGDGMSEARAEAAKIVALAFSEGAEYLPAYTPPELGQHVTPQPPPTPTTFPQMAYNGTGEPGDSIPDKGGTRKQAIPPRSTFKRPEVTDRPRHTSGRLPPATTPEPATPAASTRPVPTLPATATAVAAPTRRPKQPPPPVTAPPRTAHRPTTRLPRPAATARPAIAARPTYRPPPVRTPARPRRDCCPLGSSLPRSDLLEIATVYFRTNSDLLEGENRSALKTVARALNTYPGAQIIIEGHADSRGNVEENYRLSQDRASSVRQELLRLGVSHPERIHAYGLSEDRLVIQEDTPAAHARNRRAVIFAVRPGSEGPGGAAPDAGESYREASAGRGKPLSEAQRRLKEILARIRKTRTGEDPDAPDLADTDGTPAAAAIDDYDDDIVRAGDTLRIRVQGRDELSRSVTVNNAGELRFPLVDRLPVADRSVQEVEQDLTGALSKYIKDPQVEVTRIYRIKVFGLVGRQGIFQFDDAPSILEVVAKAEGLVKETVAETGASRMMGHFLARIVRGGAQVSLHDLSTYLKTGQGMEGVHLRDGDELIIEWNQYEPITLLGTVKTTVIYRPGLRLLEALSLAGGIQDEKKQNIKNIRILRKLEDGKTQRLEVNLHDLIHRGQVNRDIELKAGDYVVVPRRSQRITVFTAIRELLTPAVQVGILKGVF